MAGANSIAKKVSGYRQEDNVSSHSKTETFAALKLFVDNWRWQGVPFYLRTGKRLPRQISEVAIQFRRVPHRSFPPESGQDWHPSRLVLSIQPEEGIVLGFQAKYPGPKMLLRPVEMRFSYKRKLCHSLTGRLRDFALGCDEQRSHLVHACRPDRGGVADSDTRAGGMGRIPSPRNFPNYAAGTWGPKAADELLGRDGHSWSPPA